MANNRVKLDEYVRRVIKGELNLHELDKYLGNSNLATLIRRLAIERITGTDLPAIASTIIDFEEIIGENIENPIGAIQIPLGVVGPLLINGTYAKGEYYIPLATTRSELVSKINNVVMALTLSGGVRTRVLFNKIAITTSIPMSNNEIILKQAKHLLDRIDELEEIVKANIGDVKLLEVSNLILKNNILLYLTFTSSTTIEVCMLSNIVDILRNYIVRKFERATGSSLEIDLLVSYEVVVTAEALLSSKVLDQVLRVNAEKVYEANTLRNTLLMNNKIRSHYNLYRIGVLAALFLATGQNIERVVNSLSYTRTEIRNREDLYISVTLPNLEIGIFDKGINLPTQREALGILGIIENKCSPGINVGKFAEIIAATFLAGELSTLVLLVRN